MGLSRSPEAPPPPPAQPPPPSPTLCSRSCLLCVPRPKTRSNSPNRLPKAYRDEVKCSKKLLKDSKKKEKKEKEEKEKEKEKEKKKKKEKEKKKKKKKRKKKEKK
ncbi:unnamed protein product [Bemisia tabaci]|uniref:Uncharacterized protein n=1 Tax=Bemisia tabaci TaxID=7038 RepID=A0A9P0ADR0_BEMTA|nr:unnamed protein product [Bemisia tabaci]